MNAPTKNTDSPKRWNAGWFGMQLGCSAWMLGLMYIAPSVLSLVSASGIVSFVIINLIGTYMWTRSDKLDLDVAFDIFVGIAALGTFLLLVIMDVSGVLHQWEPRFANPRYAYLLMLIFPWLLFPRNRNQDKNNGQQSVPDYRRQSAPQSEP